MATIKDLLDRMLPNETDEVKEFILWNHTAYPFDSVLGTARAIRNWKRLKDQGLSECIWCGKSYKSTTGKVELGGECGDNHQDIFGTPSP